MKNLIKKMLVGLCLLGPTFAPVAANAAIETVGIYLDGLATQNEKIGYVDITFVTGGSFLNPGMTAFMDYDGSISYTTLPGWREIQNRQDFIAADCLSLEQAVSGLSFDVNYTPTAPGAEFVWNFTLFTFDGNLIDSATYSGFAPIPEPGTYGALTGLFALAAGCMPALRRRFARK